MAPRLSGQNCKFFKFLLSLNSQRRLAYKENNSRYRSLTWKPRSHVRILIYRTWPIISFKMRSVRLILILTKEFITSRHLWKCSIMFPYWLLRRFHSVHRKTQQKLRSPISDSFRHALNYVFFTQFLFWFPKFYSISVAFLLAKNLIFITEFDLHNRFWNRILAEMTPHR